MTAAESAAVVSAKVLCLEQAELGLELESQFFLLSYGGVPERAVGLPRNLPVGVAAGARVQADLVREVFGNPHREESFEPMWRTEIAVTLARQMYDARDYSLMPVLGDALGDAGCGDELVLNHCRRPGLHVRGCWVADLVLGKT